jgi:hypothetical protein
MAFVIGGRERCVVCGAAGSAFSTVSEGGLGGDGRTGAVTMHHRIGVGVGGRQPVSHRPRLRSRRAWTGHRTPLG